MLIGVNVYIWDVLFKHRHSVIITVAIHFDWCGRLHKYKTSNFIYKEESMLFRSQFKSIIRIHNILYFFKQKKI